MALCDYRLCDACGSKAFYDANLNYDFDARDPFGAPKLESVSDWVVVCDACFEKGYRAVLAVPGGEE